MPDPITNTPSAEETERYFRTDHLKADLKGRSIRGGAVTMVSQACKFVLRMGSTIVLARLLTPKDFGLIAMVIAVTGFASMFKDLGLSTATIQRGEINHGQISTLFWVNVVLSVGIMLLTVAVAPAIAWFYDEPRLTWITLVLAGSLIFGGLTVQHQALLRRQMRFLTLGTIEISSMLIGIGTAIVSAWYGATYWALVFQQLAVGITTTVGVWVACSWRPGLPVRGSGVRSMLNFGGNLTGFNVVNYFARNIDNVLIGFYWGAQQLGLYTKAYQLLLFPIRQINAPITAVAVPALSRLAGSTVRYRQAYLRILEKITMLTMPGVAFMIATSDWLVLTILGPQWSDASLIFSFFGIVALTQPISNTTGWLFITQDRTRHLFQWGFIAGTMAMVSIIAGLHWGAVGVAASYSITGLCIRTPMLFWFVGRAGPVRAGDFYRTIAPSAFASVCVLLALLDFRLWVEVSNPIFGLAFCFGITVMMTLVILIVLPAGRLALVDFKELFFSFVQKKSKVVV